MFENEPWGNRTGKLVISLKANVRGRKCKQRKADYKLLAKPQFASSKTILLWKKKKKRINSDTMHKKRRGNTRGGDETDSGRRRRRSFCQAPEVPILGREEAQQRRIKDF